MTKNQFLRGSNFFRFFHSDRPCIRSTQQPNWTQDTQSQQLKQRQWEDHWFKLLLASKSFQARYCWPSSSHMWVGGNLLVRYVPPSGGLLKTNTCFCVVCAYTWDIQHFCWNPVSKPQEARNGGTQHLSGLPCSCKLASKLHRSTHLDSYQFPQCLHLGTSTEW